MGCGNGSVRIYAAGPHWIGLCSAAGWREDGGRGVVSSDYKRPSSTSIDAVVGVTVAFQQAKIVLVTLATGVITVLLSGIDLQRKIALR